MKGAEDSEGEVSEFSEVRMMEGTEGEVVEKNANEEVIEQNEEVPIEVPRRRSSGGFFPPRPPRQMTYAEFRAAAIEAEWQEALAYAMRIPEF